MANLIVYDSQYGNTQKIAEAIAEIVNGTAIKAQEFKPELLKGVSLLIVGSPIHGWKPSEATLNFLASLSRESLKGMNVAAFDTRIKMFFAGSASDKIDKQLVALGGRSIAPPAKFIVKGKEGPLLEGELENAKHWARHILENLG